MGMIEAEEALPAKADRPTEVRSGLTPSYAQISRSIIYLLLLIGSLLPQSFSLINHDVAWLTIAAGKWLEGASYGRDLIEINTPAAMLLYLPAALLTLTVGLTPHIATTLWLDVVALCSAHLAARIAAASSGRTSDPGRTLLATLLLYLFYVFTPLFDAAQRDHFIALMIYPYALMMTADAPEASRFDRACSIVMLCAALCIKPQYLLVVLILFTVATVRYQPPGNLRFKLSTALRRFHARDVILIGALYIAGVVMFFPDWVVMVWKLAPALGGYKRSRLVTAILSYNAIIALIICVAALNLPFPRRRILSTSLTLGCATMGLVILEREPWSYHFLPIALFLGAGAILNIVCCLPSPVRLSQFSPATRIFVVLLPIALVLNSASFGLMNRNGSSIPGIAAELGKIVAPGSRVMFLSDSLYPGLSLVADQGYDWGLRYPCLWPLAGVLTLEAQGEMDPAVADRMAGEVAQAVSADIGEHSPAAIVVDRNVHLFLPAGVDILAQLRRDPGFAAAMQNYHLKTTVAGFAIYAP